MNITFDDNLITGNKTIDFQHQELIDRIRQFVFRKKKICRKKYLTRNFPHIMPNMKNSRNPFRNYMIILMKTKDLMISLSNR